MKLLICSLSFLSGVITELYLSLGNPSIFTRVFDHYIVILNHLATNANRDTILSTLVNNNSNQSGVILSRKLVLVVVLIKIYTSQWCWSGRDSNRSYHHHNINNNNNTNNNNINNSSNNNNNHIIINNIIKNNNNNNGRNNSNQRTTVVEITENIDPIIIKKIEVTENRT
ncbi:hypothetical protein ACTFIU_010515 [Dictyostelium citrinum]